MPLFIRFSRFVVLSSCKQATAQLDLFFIDDTWVRILDIIRYNKQQTEKTNKIGTHSSGILAMQGERKIFLYFSGMQHAGQNLTDVLAKKKFERHSYVLRLYPAKLSHPEHYIGYPRFNKRLEEHNVSDTAHTDNG